MGEKLAAGAAQSEQQGLKGKSARGSAQTPVLTPPPSLLPRQLSPTAIMDRDDASSNSDDDDSMPMCRMNADGHLTGIDDGSQNDLEDLKQNVQRVFDAQIEAVSVLSSHVTDIRRTDTLSQ